jgi:hypothetical protein
MIHLLLILFVLVVSAAPFSVWALAGIIKFTWRVVAGSRQNTIGRSDARQCVRAGCRTVNPVHARFCRRCGCSLAGEVAAAKPAQRYGGMSGRGHVGKV